MLLNYRLKLMRLILIYYFLLCRCQESAVPLVCWGNGQFLLGQPQVLLSATTFFTSFWPIGWYAEFRPVRAREEDEDPPHGEIGSVVFTGNTPPSAEEGPAFSLEDDNETAAAAAATPAAAQRGGGRRSACAPTPPAPRRRLSDYDVQHVVHGI